MYIHVGVSLASCLGVEFLCFYCMSYPYHFSVFLCDFLSLLQRNQEVASTKEKVEGASGDEG